MKRNDTVSTPHIEELRRKKKKAFKVKVVIFSSIVLVVLTGFVCTLRIRNIRIQTVTISGTKVLEPTLLEQTIRTDLAGYYLWVIPKNDIVFYPKRKILRDLRTAFPRIKDISISLANSRTVAVTLTERIGESLWCGATFPEPSGKSCYFMDDTGTIFTEAPYYSGSVYFRWYGGNITPDINPIGNSVFAPDAVHNLEAFVSSLHDLDLKPYAMVVVDEGDYEIYLEQPSSIGVKIIFKPSDDLEKISQNLSAAIATEPLKTVRDEGFKSITYIDLRYQNKVYFK